LPVAVVRITAERAEFAVKLAWGTPANEIANMITYDEQRDLIPLLKGEIKGDPERLNSARRQVAAVCEDGPHLAEAAALHCAPGIVRADDRWQD